MKTAVRWSALALTIAFIAMVVGGAVVNWTATERINERLDDVRRAGAPIAMASVAPPDCTPEENAAMVLLGAFDGLPADLDAVRLDGSIPAADLAARLPDLVARCADRLAAARSVLQRPRCRFDIDYAAGASAELRHVRPLLLGAKLLAAEAFDRRSRDEMAGSVDSALDLLQLATLLREEPILVTQLVRGSMVVEAMGLIEGQPMSRSQEDRFLALSDLVDLRQGLVRALQADRAMIIQLYHDLLSGHAPGMGIPAHLSWLPMRPLVRNQFAAYLEAMNELVELGGRDYAVARDRMRDLEEQLRGLSTAGTFVASVSRSAQAVAMAQVRLELGRAALEIRRSGTPVSRVDPFSGVPYGVRDGLVWSVGEDGKDDGGQSGLDVVWRVR